MTSPPRCSLSLWLGFPLLCGSLAPEERQALEDLSKIAKRPVNQLVNEAIKLYLSHSRNEEKNLGTTLEKLREYRKRDPGFKHALAPYVGAEAKLVHDPAEGEPGEFVNGKFRPFGPARRKVRELLGAELGRG